MKNWIKAIGIVALKILFALFTISIIIVCVYLIGFLFPSLLLNSGILPEKMGMKGARVCECAFMVCAGILIFWIWKEHEKIEDDLQIEAYQCLSKDGYSIKIDGEHSNRSSSDMNLTQYDLRTFFDLLKIDHHKKIVYLRAHNVTAVQSILKRKEES